MGLRKAAVSLTEFQSTYAVIDYRISLVVVYFWKLLLFYICVIKAVAEKYRQKQIQREKDRKARAADPDNVWKKKTGQNTTP